MPDAGYAGEKHMGARGFPLLGINLSRTPMLLCRELDSVVGVPGSRMPLPHVGERPYSMLAGIKNGRPHSRRSCPSSVRVNTRGLPSECHKGKKAHKRGPSLPLSGPLIPGDALDAGRVDARRLLRPPHRVASHHSLAHTPTGWGHGGTRKSSTSRSVQTWSVSPAAMAGVQGRHWVAEPQPWAGSGWDKGRRTLAWGKQKL
jgi:hypothetical protein